jgi:two-component system sensor histidine kinase KdpD
MSIGSNDAVTERPRSGVSATTIAEDTLPAVQRLLAVVRPEDDADKVVRWAHRLASSLQAHWIVLYIETSRSLPDAALTRVTKALALARELGADVITTADADLATATLRVSAQRDANLIIVGHTDGAVGRNVFRRDAFVSKLLKKSGDAAVQIIPVGGYETVAFRGGVSRSKSDLRTQYIKALGVIGLVTAAAFLFTPLVGAHTTALVFLLTVVLLALFVERGPTLAAAALSAVSWDYFFLPPVFAFQIHHFEDAMLFGMYFVVALVLGHLTTRIRAQQAAERERETRATALYLLTRDLNESVDLDSMVQRIVRQLESCFRGPVAVLLPAGDNMLHPHNASTFQIPDSERYIVHWVQQYHQRAGNLTNHSPMATALYVPLLTSDGLVGVLALSLKQPLEFSLHQQNLIEAFSQQIAMALDRHRLNGISQKAKLLAESERLSKTLLDSMSHEIRTPIAAITSATGNLAELQDTDTKLRQDMIAEIQEATGRLNRVVGNVLEASRLESGAVKPRFNECDVSELIHVVLADMEKELSAHKVAVAIEPGLPVIPMDFVLMQQVLTNLLSNCVLHTPPATWIKIAASLDDGTLLLSVVDTGPGIPRDSLPRIFDKFYRVPNSRTGGTGLGLSLVKGFVEAQGGRVTVESVPGAGLAFHIRLPRTSAALIRQEAQI